MKPRSDALSIFWPIGEAPAREPSAARAAGLRMAPTPHQLKADRTTSLVRDMTDAAAKARHANVARLREARLARDAAAEVAASAAVEVAAPAKKRRGKA